MGHPLGLPDITAGNYLLTALFDAGPSEMHPMGEEVGLSWVSLDAYGRATRVISEAWEYQALHDMSAAYVAAKTEGADVFAIPPVEQD